MEETYRNQKLSGYKIGEDIRIHFHIHDPDSYFLTIRKLNIHGKRLCDIECSKDEIARYVNVQLQKNLNVINALIKETIPFT